MPAPTVNVGGDSRWKWPNLRLSRARDLDLGWGHTAYHHASLIDLYLRIKFHWNLRNVLWTDGRTARNLRPTLLGRLGGVDLNIRQQYTELTNSPVCGSQRSSRWRPMGRRFPSTYTAVPPSCQRAPVQRQNRFYHRKRQHGCWKLRQEFKWIVINFLAKMASHKGDAYQTEPRTYVLFRLCSSWTINATLKKIWLSKEMFLAGYHLG